jgi:hypothetical protein
MKHVVGFVKVDFLMVNVKDVTRDKSGSPWRLTCAKAEDNNPMKTKTNAILDMGIFKIKRMERID